MHRWSKYKSVAALWPGAHVLHVLTPSTSTIVQVQATTSRAPNCAQRAAVLQARTCTINHISKCKVRCHELHPLGELIGHVLIRHVIELCGIHGWS